jgi:hypothetical protein
MSTFIETIFEIITGILMCVSIFTGILVTFAYRKKAKIRQGLKMLALVTGNAQAAKKIMN